MNFWISDYFKNISYFFTWRDAVEIMLISVIIYYASLWLKKDRQKNLLLYFYGYCLVLCIACNLDLSTITYLLMMGTPILCVLFIIIHQATLQKNFVGLRTHANTQPKSSEWLELLVQTSLISINNNKELIWIIEHTDSLGDLLTTPMPFDAHIKKDLLAMTVDSQLFNNSRMLWTTSRGILLGINTEWKITQEFYLNDASPAWKEEAIFFTTKTDALVCKTNSSQRTFDIIVRGTMFEQVTADKALYIIKKTLGIIEDSRKGITHAPHHAQERIQQPNA